MTDSNREFDPDTLNGTPWFYCDTRPRRIINFVERYHWHQEFPDKQFILQPLQKAWIQEFYGVKCHDTGLDRYRYMYLTSGKGVGKTPLGTVLCLAELLISDTPNPLIINTAASYSQATIAYNRAKWHIKQYPKALRDQVKVQEDLIIHSERYARWLIMSGNTTSGSGTAPSLFYVDELHEIKAKQEVLFGVMEGNLAKRPNSKCIITTNAGLDQTSLCWAWNERAQKELEARAAGTPQETDLLPLIYAAGPTDDIYAASTQAKANPFIGITIPPGEYEKQAAKAKQSTGVRLTYERLWLGKWCKQAKQWLDPEDIKQCLVDAIPAEIRASAPLWIGFDLGPTDDITAAIFLYCDRGTDTVWLDCLNWIPRPAADDFQSQNGVPFMEWALGVQAAEATDDAPAVKAVPPCITVVNAKALVREHKEAIAQTIIAYAGRKPEMFCPDKSYASDVLETINKAGWDLDDRVGLSHHFLDPPTRDFEARIKTDKVKIVRNACYLWQLSNAALEVNAQEKVKPERMGGVNNNPRKIDALMATLYGLSAAKLYMDQGKEAPVTPIDEDFYLKLMRGDIAKAQ